MEKIKELLEKAKALLVKILLAPLQIVAKTIQLLLKPILHPVTMLMVGMALGFLAGGRFHETGKLAGKFGKDYKGTTVFLSGLCDVDGKPRLPAFAEDEVKVTSIDGEKLLGVVRLTRESIECDLSKIAVDSLPLLANLAKSPAKIPDLEIAPTIKEERPKYKDLEKRTVLVSGSCVNVNNEAVPPFIDEQVDVTSTDPVRDSKDKESFVLNGIKKSDKQMIRCLSNAIAIKEIPTKKEDSPGLAVVEDKKSQVGEIILVTGSCFPDERTNLNRKSRIRALYKLASTRVEVLEDRMDKNGRIVYVAGTVLDEPYKTEQIICDREKIPFIYKEYDPESMKLENKVTTESIDAPVVPSEN